MFTPGNVVFVACFGRFRMRARSLTFPLRVDFVNAASGRRITVDGYWDGGNRWVVRYALPETGTWNWTAASSDSGLRGSGNGKAKARDVEGTESAVADFDDEPCRTPDQAQHAEERDLDAVPHRAIMAYHHQP